MLPENSEQHRTGSLGTVGHASLAVGKWLGDVVASLLGGKMA